MESFHAISAVVKDLRIASVVIPTQPSMFNWTIPCQQRTMLCTSSAKSWPGAGCCSSISPISRHTASIPNCAIAAGKDSSKFRSVHHAKTHNWRISGNSYKQTFKHVSAAGRQSICFLVRDARIPRAQACGSVSWFSGLKVYDWIRFCSTCSQCSQ